MGQAMLLSILFARVQLETVNVSGGRRAQGLYFHAPFVGLVFHVLNEMYPSFVCNKHFVDTDVLPKCVFLSKTLVQNIHQPAQAPDRIIRWVVVGQSNVRILL